MKLEIVFTSLLGFLCGGLVGTVVQQIAIHRLLFADKKLPWRIMTRLTRYFGWMSWSKSCARVEASERALYATILTTGSLCPYCLVNWLKEHFGSVAEAPRIS